MKIYFKQQKFVLLKSIKYCMEYWCNKALK